MTTYTRARACSARAWPFAIETTDCRRSRRRARMLAVAGVVISSARTPAGSSRHAGQVPARGSIARRAVEARAASRPRPCRRGRRRTRAAGAVDVAGDDVQHVERPGLERAERAADGAAERTCALRRRDSRASRGSSRPRRPSPPAARSGVKGPRARAATRRRSQCAARKSRSSRPSRGSQGVMARRRKASRPADEDVLAFAIFAVSERRGSTTTTLPPRSTTLRSRVFRVHHVYERSLRDRRVRATTRRCVPDRTSGNGLAEARA